MTATAIAPPDEQLVAEKTDTVIFLSRRSDLRLVKVPVYPQFGPSGQKVGEHPGVAVQFRGSRFDCPRDGEVILADGRKGDAAEILEWLENHRSNGDVNEGFWRVDPTAPAPTADELRAIMQAAIEFDEETLERLIAQERAGWERPALLDVAEDALERIRTLRAEAEAKIAAQPTPPAEGADPTG